MTFLFQLLICVVLHYLAATQDCESDILFILDATDSVRDEYQDQIDFIVKVIQDLDIGPEIQVGLVLYASGSKQRVAIPFGFYEQDTLIKQVQEQPFLSGITNTGASLLLAGSALESGRPSASINVLAVTDGFSWDEIKGPAEELRNHGRGVTIFAVAVVTPFNIEALQLIGDVPENVFIGPESGPDLIEALKSSCKQKVTQPPTTKATTRAPRPTVGPQTSKIKSQAATTARVTQKAAKTTKRAPTAAPIKSSDEERCFLDIMFIIDESGSVTESFGTFHDLAVRLIGQLTLGERNARVAMLRFATRAVTEFRFDEYETKDELTQAVLRTKQRGGLTNIGAALELADSELSEERGARTGAAHVIIIFTDGYSWDYPLKAAEKLHSRDVLIYAVAVKRKAVNRHELNIIAGSEENVYLDDRFAEFEEQLNALTTDC